MSVLANQRRLLLDLLGELAPHWRRDPHLPVRLQRWLARHRAGSRDRRLYRELAYTAARILPWLENTRDDEARVGLLAAEAAETSATRDFRTAYARPELVAEADPRLLLPAWCETEMPAIVAEPAQRSALLSRAPLWLRLQTDDHQAVEAEFASRGWTWQTTPVLADAWRLAPEHDVSGTEAYQRGLVEIQDLGSQLILGRAGITPGEHWLDACAGAGGKTLQLAALLGPAGQVAAHDIRPAALDELMRRAARAGHKTITRLNAPAAENYDGVLVDAPCSGTGTWRRAPHLKWYTTPAELRRQAERQRELLAQFAAGVRPRARLIYATCSLCRVENEAVVGNFLATHPHFSLDPEVSLPSSATTGPGHLITPATHDTDGFYTAYLRRMS